ncbi:MAG: phosphoglucosamine mutase [Proteobacteria bacterium]|nr:phosphoglucosamine mutase [Pseudomonadota bacterium]
MKKYFGTDGIRGEVGSETIHPEFMLKLGWAAGKVFGSHNSVTKVLIGKDTRISGYVLESALQAGLSAAGANVHLVGPIPTPAVAYLTHSLRATAGIVISASHNSYKDNGVKFFDRNGMKLSDQYELEIEGLLSKPIKMIATHQLGKLTRIYDAAGRYISFCKSTFPSALTLNGLKIVVDCAHGAGYHVAPLVFSELGAEVITLGEKPNGVNINHECGATDVRALQQVVIQHKAVAGIALDGDGDRLIMVDHQGERVDGDELLGIMACYNGGQYEGIAGTVMSNLGLEQAIKQRGMQFVRTAVGDRYVLEELLAKKWILGGESSGHIVNLQYATTGDGIISALQILAIMQRMDQPLAQLKKVVVMRPQVLINVPLQRSGALDLRPDSKIGQAAKQVENDFAGTGRVLLRTSGTEPVIRVMVEGEDAAKVRQTAQYLAELIRSSN